MSDWLVEVNWFPKCLLKRFSISNSSSDRNSSSCRHTDASCLHVIENTLKFRTLQAVEAVFVETVRKVI